MSSWSKHFDEDDELKVGDWSDMKQYDDDHDNEWFIAEEKRMAEQYGGSFIRVKYSSQGRVGYFCEICTVECNARKSLDAHCSGMKHLKKKNVWEGEKDKSGDEETNYYPTGPLKKWDRGEDKDRHQPAKKTRSLFSERLGPYPSESRKDRDVGEDKYRHRPPTTKTGYFSDERAEPYPRKPRSPVSKARRSRPRDEYFKERYMEPNGPPYFRNKPDSREEESFPSRSRSRPRRASRSPPPPAPAPPPPTPPPAPPISKEELSKSPAGTLLKKLSECSIKTKDDSSLALNVVTALTKSLKEYHSSNDKMVAELLMESELKLATVKTLLVEKRIMLGHKPVFASTLNMTPRPTYGSSSPATYNILSSGSFDYSHQRGSSSFITPSFK